MPAKQGSYHDVYIKKDGQYISLEQDTKDFCEKWIKPVHPDEWDWTTRDFEKPQNDPTIEEARVIRDLLIADMDKKEDSQVDLSSLVNGKAIRAFMNPESPDEVFNMDEFAYALKVELEHGRIKDANVTNNHPFLTAMIVLAHMSETVTYYKRLQVMETEGEIFELKRKLDDKVMFKGSVEKKIEEAEQNLIKYKAQLERRLQATVGEIPVLDEIGD